jgi:hypothetical protein
MFDGLRGLVPASPLNRPPEAHASDGRSSPNAATRSAAVKWPLLVRSGSADRDGAGGPPGYAKRQRSTRQICADAVRASSKPVRLQTSRPSKEKPASAPRCSCGTRPALRSGRHRLPPVSAKGYSRPWSADCCNRPRIRKSHPPRGRRFRPATNEGSRCLSPGATRERCPGSALRILIDDARKVLR